MNAMIAANAPRTERPWGWFETLGEAPGYRVKRLLIRAGRRISLQRHQHRGEHWVVVSGRGILELAERRIETLPGGTLFIPTGAKHRASACGADDLVIIEVQRGDVLREDDIERYEDDYGRVIRSMNSL